LFAFGHTYADQGLLVKTVTTSICDLEGKDKHGRPVPSREKNGIVYSGCKEGTQFIYEPNRVDIQTDQRLADKLTSRTSFSPEEPSAWRPP